MGNSVVFLTSEIYPFSKTGGLSDVLGALPVAISEHGVKASVITPYYGKINTGRYRIKTTHKNIPVGYPWAPTTADVHEVLYHNIPIYFIARDEFFDRKNYYNTPTGDYFDNAERFIFFCRAAVSFLETLGTAPTIVHANDWQTALCTAYIHYKRKSNPYWMKTKTVLSVHNLAFQGRFSSRLFEDSGLPPEAWNVAGAEFYGDFNMLKAGIMYADKITTVSPSHAEEITRPEFGCQLDGVLRHRLKDLCGILNGVDYGIWNPETSQYLLNHYSSDDLTNKAACKKIILQELELDPSLMDRPVLGFVGRLQDQKGIDLIFDIIPQLIERNLGLVVIGQGKPEYEELAIKLMEKYHGHFAAVVDYTEPLAHRIQAGCDMFLMPSRYEPCGLTQLYALKFGTPPIATQVGGLKDSICPWPDRNATGFMLKECSSEALLDAIIDAVNVWETDKARWNKIVRTGINQEFTWKISAKKYLDVYKQIGLEASV